ncbi:MAG TPA: Do family serine endopeptidase [Cellvibrio sp.]|nr:Do family serine endopeptidase [Cellvibrio sp.]
MKILKYPNTFLACLGFCLSATLALSAISLPTLAAPPLQPQDLANFTTLIEQSGPAVVNIRTTQKVLVDQANNAPSAEEQELFRRYFGLPSPSLPNSGAPLPQEPAVPQELEEEISQGVGSGFIFSEDGYVLSNAHVVKNADEVFVKLTDKREFKAKIIGVDINTDVAVLKIDGSNLPKVVLGDAAEVKVGEWVIAIGSPFDLDNSISAGIISAKAREIGDFLLLIQTDVAINPGNSGGPLINMRGEVIGINSQIYSRSGGYMGISFAIPINDAIRVAEQLKRNGRVSRGRMGIYLADVSSDVALALNLPKQSAALISRIEEGGPAQKAGLQEGDIILQFNQTSIDKSTELRRLAAATPPSTQVKLTIWRKGISKVYPLTLAELSQEPAAASSGKKETAKEKKYSYWGLEVKSLDGEQGQRAAKKSGVAIASAAGPAARAGLQAQDIIYSINNQDINSEAEFKSAFAKADPSKPVAILARRGTITQYIAIPASAK